MIGQNAKLVAALVPPQWLDGAHLLDERRRARQDQKRIEQNRLMTHQQEEQQLRWPMLKKSRGIGAAGRDDCHHVDPTSNSSCVLGELFESER